MADQLSPLAEKVLDGFVGLAQTARGLAEADRAYAGYRAGTVEVEDATRLLMDRLGLSQLAAWQALNAEQAPSRKWLDDHFPVASAPNSTGGEDR